MTFCPLVIATAIGLLKSHDSLTSVPYR
jgi:hypothetical protein